jgi:hypothetical protein
MLMEVEQVKEWVVVIVLFGFWFVITGLHFALVRCFHLTKTVLPGGKGRR